MMIYAFAVGFCVVFFVLGVEIGMAIQHRREADAHLLIGQVSAGCASRLAETNVLTKAARGLNEACLQHQPRLPDNIRHGSDSVVRAANALKKQLESMTKLTSVFQQSRIKLSKAATAGDEPSGLCDQERVERTLFIDNHPKTSSEVASFKSLHLDVWQYVAPFDGDTIPRPEAFELVHCTGSSGNSFSYFARLPPACQKLIVAVGSPSDLQFYVAETLHTRPARAEGQQGFLSTCLVAQKLTDIYKWNSAQCRIAMCADLARV